MTRFAHIALAVGFVLASATDWELTIQPEDFIEPPPAICAKSAATCEQARAAIRAGRWPIAAPDAETRCAPHADCFAPESNVIPGYNAKGKR